MERCEKCKHEWLPREKIPKACPRCKSYRWNTKKHKKGEKENGKA